MDIKVKLGFASALASCFTLVGCETPGEPQSDTVAAAMSFVESDNLSDSDDPWRFVDHSKVQNLNEKGGMIPLTVEFEKCSDAQKLDVATKMLAKFHDAHPDAAVMFVNHKEELLDDDGQRLFPDWAYDDD